MRTRNLIFVIGAVVVVVITAAAAFVILDSPKEDVGDGTLTTVIVSTEDIPGSQRLDPLIEEGLFEERMVPQDLLVHGAITSLNHLRGATTTMPVLRNEQISTARLSYEGQGISPLSP